MTADTSLFTYTDGMSTANYSFPDHMPVFLDELSNETIASARLCVEMTLSVSMTLARLVTKSLPWQPLLSTRM